MPNGINLTTQTSLAPLRYYHKEPWQADNRSGSDAIIYKINFVGVGHIITNEKFIELSELISKEATRRGVYSLDYPINPPDGDKITADDHAQMADTLNQLQVNVVTGPEGTPYRGNGFSSLPSYPATGWITSTSKVVGVQPLTTNKLIFGRAQIGDLISANVIPDSAAFNKLIESVIYAGEQCWCNCNYCACNCNYCTCNCNFACTCNCNYSDENTKENIEYI